MGLPGGWVFEIGFAPSIRALRYSGRARVGLEGGLLGLGVEGAGRVGLAAPSMRASALLREA